MAGIIKATYPQNCIGCDMCVFECQRQLKKIGLNDSLIRILRDKKPDQEFPVHNVDIDPRINNLDIDKIKKICPTAVFEIEEETHD